MNYLIGGVAIVVLAIIGFSTFSANKEIRTINQGPVEKIEYRKISQEDAKNMLDSEKEVILLDVRTPEEYNERHIPNSILIPVDQIDNVAITRIPDKQSKILVYCRSGNRSRTASIKLISMGYTNVLDFGGIIEWKYETQTTK